MRKHGGDVWQVAEEFGISVEKLLDFSANVNPRGLPRAARERLANDAANPRLLSFYPDPSAASLRWALSEKLNISADGIVIGPGAEALFSPILRALAPRRALIPIPAFSEYRRVCEAEKIDVATFALDRSKCFRLPLSRFCDKIEPGDVVFVNSPHNPSGALVSRTTALEICEIAASRKAALVLDEAFVDYAPESSLVREAATRPGIVVLRSLTKFYGCPALRIGYAVAHPTTIMAIRSFLPAWPVTQLALDALAAAIGDCDYDEQTRRENSAELEWLASSLNGLGFFVFPSGANFLLLELAKGMPHASELRRVLIANNGILVRNCDSYEGLTAGRFIRIAVRSGGENRQLISAIAELTESNWC